MSSERMLAGFALYNESAAKPPAVGPGPHAIGPHLDHNTMQMQPGTRLHRIIRLYHGWRIWIATRDYIFGNYLELFDDGHVLNCTVRVDEGDDYYWARPSDDEIRSKQ
jgi:hypothetical protein